jgi:hypothetical protein
LDQGAGFQFGVDALGGGENGNDWTILDDRLRLFPATYGIEDDGPVDDTPLAKQGAKHDGVFTVGLTRLLFEDYSLRKINDLVLQRVGIVL